MNIKDFKSILVNVGLGCLISWRASAQLRFSAQPTDSFVSPGQTASFQFTCLGGTGPLGYQWFFNAAVLTDATNATLLVTNAQPARDGDYFAVVSDGSGSITSAVAVLKVYVPGPHAIQNLTLTPGNSAVLELAGESAFLFGPYYDLYPLETSSNLVEWTPLVTLQQTNTAPDTPRFLDDDASKFSQRFYRTSTNQLVTPDPQPTGPYAVGSFSMLLTDPSRTNTVRQTNYQFMVTFWYPAVVQAGVLPAKYLDPQVALGGTYDLTSWGGDNFSSQVAGFFSHSLLNAPLATNQAMYPVVLYDPGLRGHRRQNTDKAEDLASWGYIVVGLDTSDTHVSVFPNGSVVSGGGDFSTIQGVDAAIEGRLLDEQFVLDELKTLNADDPRLGGRLALDKVGAFGWSLGGATAAQLCLRDPRCKAGAAMDGAFFETNLLTQPLHVAFLFLRSDSGPDPDPFGSWPDAPPDDRLQVFNEQVTNAYWVRLVSTVHPSFSDFDLILDSASLVAAGNTPMSGQFLPRARVSQIVRGYLLSFFNKFLQGQDDHLLDGPAPGYPEIMQLLGTSGYSGPPAYPAAAVVQGRDGNFYGTTEYGGTSGDGTVFQVTPAGALSTLVSFNGPNGSHPAAAVVQGSDGNFYGTTEYGGTNGNNGTVFQMTPAGALTTLVSFNGRNGSHPVAGLAQGSDGNFYGTTILGGANNRGTVFQVTPVGALTTLVSCNGATANAPSAALLQDTNGNFYGTTVGGGDLSLGGDFGSLNTGYGAGIVFKMTPAGTLTPLVEFNGDNGANPAGVLVQGSDGSFYGTTPYGGNTSLNGWQGFGTVFKVTPAGALTTLVVFNGANGSYSIGGLLQGSDGNFYCTTEGGGAGGGGTVFKMTPAGVVTMLVSFNGANGSSPSGLVQGSDGNFYGTTKYGGASGGGTVFKMTLTGAITTLVAF